MKLLFLYYIILFYSCTQTATNSSNRPVDTTGLPTLPVDLTSISKTAARAERSASRANLRIDTVQNTLGSFSTSLTSSEIKQVNSLILASANTTIKSLQDTAKALRAQINILKASQLPLQKWQDSIRKFYMVKMNPLYYKLVNGMIEPVIKDTLRH